MVSLLVMLVELLTVTIELRDATLIETMLAIWTSTLYGEIPAPPGPGHPPA
jgi:hypothetical protein